MIIDDADGTTDLSLTILDGKLDSNLETLPVAGSFANVIPIFFGERPSGPIFGAKDEVAPTSPPTTRRKTSTIAVGSNFGGILSYPNYNLLDNRNRTQKWDESH